MGVSRKWKRFALDGMASFTYLDPQNPDGLKDLNGDETASYLAQPPVPPTHPDYTKYLDDVPSTLKYRNEWLVRAYVSLSYKRFNFTVQYRFNSQIENIDKLMLIVAPGVGLFRDSHRAGSQLMDFTLGYRYKKHAFSFHTFNLFNFEYAIIPGYLGEQRAFAFQYRFQLR